jgi:PhnB protein
MASDSSVRTSVAPLLSVRGGARAVEFYKAAFGAVETFRVEDPSGAVVATLAVDSAAFWVADESPEHGNFSPPTLGGGTVRMVLTVADPDALFTRAVNAGARVVTVRMVLTVADPDALFTRAVNAGARVVRAMADEYGWRLGRIEDPFGHHWEIGRPVHG